MATRSPKRARFSLALVFFMMGSLCFGAAPAAAQINIGADLMSRYVWRGFDFGESFSVQPDLSYSTGGLTVGTWASYSIAADGAAANEHDLYASYSFGYVSVGLTDFYFPSPVGADGDVAEGAEFFNYDGDGEGAHYLEPSLSFSGPEAFPISLFGSAVVHNAPNYPVYLEASFPFTVEGVDMSLSTGGVIVSPDDDDTPVEETDAFYGLPESAYTKAAISAAKSIQVTDSFDLPISTSFILNPYTERTFLVFGVSLSP